MTELAPLDRQLLSEFDLGSARGGAKLASPMEIEIVRPLNEGDLEALRAPQALGAKPALVKELRSHHHQIAQLLAAGRDLSEVALSTGYSISYLSSLQNQDPAFAELIEVYREERALVFVDLAERQKALGVATLEELASRLETDPNGWTKKELMALAELCGVGQGPGSGGPRGPAGQPPQGGAMAPISIAVNFVGAGAAGASRPSIAVDAKYEELEEG